MKTKKGYIFDPKMGYVKLKKDGEQMAFPKKKALGKDRVLPTRKPKKKKKKK